MFDWNDLRYLLAVARMGSTHAAAKALGVSQPTIQRRLAALEAQLGRKLVERHRSGYRLTKIGEALIPYAERVEESTAAFERHLLASDEEVCGVIRLTCAEGMASRFVTPLVDLFHTAHPKVHVALIMTDRFLDLAKGEADAAVRAYNLGGGARHPGENDLVRRKVGDAPWTLYASRLYVERHGRPKSLADLDAHALIGFAGEMANNHAGQWLRRTTPNAVISAEGNTMLGLVAAVKSGAGITPLPMMLAEPEPDLVRLFEPISAINSEINLLAHRDLRATPRIGAFFDFAVTHVDRFRPLLRGERRDNG